MKGPIGHANGSGYELSATVRTALSQRAAKNRQSIEIDWSRFKVIDSADSTHRTLHFESTAVQHVKKLLRVRVIVQDPAINFSPCMSVERHLVHANYHLRRHAEAAQQADQNACPLQ